MELVKATAGVHWLTGSTSAGIDAVRAVVGRLSRPEAPGRFGQPLRRLHESGVEVFCGSDVPGQRIVINAPGEVCETHAADVAQWLLQLDARCTRVDVAMDVFPSELARRRMVYMRRAWKRDQVETRIKRESMAWWENDEGATLYFGKPASELMLRAYDRRGPLRIETQWRPQGEARELVPELLIRKGAAHMWRRCAKRVRFKLDWYEQLIAGEVEDVLPDQRVQSALDDAMYHLWKQHGLSFWMLGMIGVKLSDLERVPTQLTSDQAAKFRKWLISRENAGQDVSYALAELEKRCPK